MGRGHCIGSVFRSHWGYDLERSTEVEAFIATMYALMRNGDGAGCGDLLDDEVTIFIGTDTEEWWDTPAMSKAAFQEQLETTGGFDNSAGGPVGRAEGAIGWVADQPTMRIGDLEVPMRMTCVLRRVDDDWRIVQGHLSVPANIKSDLFA